MAALLFLPMEALERRAGFAEALRPAVPAGEQVLLQLTQAPAQIGGRPLAFGVVNLDGQTDPQAAVGEEGEQQALFDRWGQVETGEQKEAGQKGGETEPVQPAVFHASESTCVCVKAGQDDDVATQEQEINAAVADRAELRRQACVITSELELGGTDEVSTITSGGRE